VGSVFVGGDVEFALQKIAAVEEFLSGSDFNQRILRRKILKIQLTLGPSLKDRDQQPAAIF